MEDGVRVYDWWNIDYRTNENVLDVYNAVFPQHFAEHFGLNPAILQIEKTEIEYAHTNTPVVNVHFNSGLMMETLPNDALKCVVDTLGYMFGIENVRLMAGGAVLVYHDAGQDEEGVFKCEALETEEVEIGGGEEPEGATGAIGGSRDVSEEDLEDAPEATIKETPKEAEEEIFENIDDIPIYEPEYQGDAASPSEE